MGGHPGTEKYSWARCRSLCLFGCLVLLCVVMVFHALTQLLNQDEEVFVTAGYLAQRLRLYTDFLYLQSPIYPLVLSRILALFPGDSPFLVARLLSAALAIGSVLAFFAIATRLCRNEKFALLITALFATAPLMLLAYGSARNDIMPIFFGLCGVWLTLYGLDAARKPRSGNLTLFLAGLCMALAVGTKVTAAFIPVSALAYVFWYARRMLTPLIVGGAVGSLPILYYVAVDFDKFAFSNAIFHFTIYKQFYADIGLGETLTFPFVVKSMLAIWLGEPMLVVATLFFAVVAFLAWQRKSKESGTATRPPADGTFIYLLAVAALPFVFLPIPTDKQYLQPAIPYVLLSCATLVPLAQKCFERREALAFTGLAVAVLALQVGRFAIQAVQHFERPLWTPSEIHELSKLIRSHVKDGPVATLYPMIVLDAGGEIYPEFSTGVFIYRSADHLPPERVQELHGVSPGTLPLLLKRIPPAAVFLGNANLDPVFLNWAQKNCYREIALSDWKGGAYEVDGWKPRLFVRPTEPVSCAN